MQRLEERGLVIIEDIKSEDIATSTWGELRRTYYIEVPASRALRRLFDRRKKLEQLKDTYKVGLRKDQAHGMHTASALRTHQKKQRFCNVKQSTMILLCQKSFHPACLLLKDTSTMLSEKSLRL